MVIKVTENYHLTLQLLSGVQSDLLLLFVFSGMQWYFLPYFRHSHQWFLLLLSTKTLWKYSLCYPCTHQTVCKVWFILKGLIFPIVTAVLYIIPLITRLLANTKKTWHSVSFYNLIVTVHSVFQQRNIVRQTDAVLLLPLRCFPPFFFSWLVTTNQPFAKSWNHCIFQEYG